MSTARVVLGSASPARLATLRAAGIACEVIVSGVDESGVVADSPAELAATLATLKGDAVADRVRADVGHDEVVIVLGCDSVMEFGGEAYGRPPSVDVARQRWQRMRGDAGILYTGHRVIVLRAGSCEQRTVVAATKLQLAHVTDAEIEAYLATGEPLDVAGGLTIDGLGGAFVTALDGDPHNVVGISLPLLRVTLAKMGIVWTDLWNTT